MKLTIRLLIVTLIALFFVNPSCKPVDYSDDINSLQAKTDSLAEALQITNANLQATNMALESLTVTVTSMQIQLNEISGQISTLNTQLTATNATVTDQANIIASIQADIAVIQDQIDNLNTQQIATTSTVNDLSTTIISIQTQIEYVLTQLETLDSQQTDTNTSLSDIYAQLALSNDQLSTLSSQFSVLLTQLGLVIDIEGNIYHKVTIGNQVWMVENLRTTKFSNGDPIPYLPTSVESGYRWYDDNLDNKNTYGALYNLATVTDTRGLCPVGWHIPTTGDWIALSNFLGGNNVAGGKLKEAGTVHWQSPNAVISNPYAFHALPGGAMNCAGYFVNMGTNAHWWTSAPAVSGKVTAVTLFYDNTQFQMANGFECNKYSVRCIKD